MVWKTYSYLTGYLFFDYHHHRNIQEDFRPVRLLTSSLAVKLPVKRLSSNWHYQSHKRISLILRPQGLFGPHDTVMLPRLLQMIKYYGTLLLPVAAMRW